MRLEALKRRRQLHCGRHQGAGGAGGRGANGWDPRAKASNRIGAAAVRPAKPLTGAPSGLPTQTPMVRLPSKPTAQASR